MARKEVIHSTSEMWRIRQDHLGAVAEIALKIKDNRFINQSSDALINAIKESKDPRISRTYTESRLKTHPFWAGRELLDQFALGEDDTLKHAPISLLVISPRFSEIVPYDGWRNTLTNISKTFPDGTTTFQIIALLTNQLMLNRNMTVSDLIEKVKNNPR